MTELDPYQWEVDGFNLGDAGVGIVNTEGVEDSADLETASTDRWGDGSHSGQQRLTSRLVTLTLAVSPDTDPDAEKALRIASAPLTDRFSRRLARFRHRTTDLTRRFLYEPAPGRPLSIPGDFNYLRYRHADNIVVRLKARDPILYADTPTVTAFVDGATHTIVNDGTIGAQSVSSALLGAMSWSITAGGGGCVRPYVQHADFPGEMWLLNETLAAGATVTVDPARVTRIGVSVRRSTPVGPGASPIPRWPVLRPGDNDITMDCDSGSFTANLTTRSTW